MRTPWFLLSQINNFSSEFRGGQENLRTPCQRHGNASWFDRGKLNQSHSPCQPGVTGWTPDIPSLCRVTSDLGSISYDQSYLIGREVLNKPTYTSIIVCRASCRFLYQLQTYQNFDNGVFHSYYDFMLLSEF